jgi:hypothetical protein
MTSAPGAAQVVEDCRTAGVGKVWLYRGGGRGAVSPRAVELCEQYGIEAVIGECPYMFFPGKGLIHQLHGLIRKVTGRYPAADGR